MPLFKSPEEQLQEGNDRVLRGDFTGAQRSFLSAAEGFGKKGRTGEAQFAQTFAVLMGLAVPQAGAQDYQRVAEALAPLGSAPIKLGTRSVSAADLRREAELAREEKDVLASGPRTPEAHEQAGARLQALSLAYRQLGNQVLVLPELFRRGAVPASSKAPVLAALAEEEFGESEVTRDPKRAAEHNQNARNWWMQAGESARAEAAGQRVQRYGRAVRCWFCGREAAGDGINFRGLSSDIAGFEHEDGGGGALQDSDASRGIVYACRPCASTVERLADEKAQARTKEIEDRVNRMLAQMRQKAGPMGQQWIPASLPP
ncbi:MAG: hypothetical protein KGJ23_04730 [Euryarchaeota archaeon]|nr:hypothetical protein [Euryarchaeota archaeon]MDE1835904.1 hypothetical protein [Euryarchaeota archaeon]MDE1880221.1 hypothetical protein [Euryarchaeota archaeon]MDE2044418.1 hypothetical protein [Thermoplasmata archaeon]